MHDANPIDIGINTCKLLAMRKTEKHYQMAYNCLYQSISDEKQIKNGACLIRIYTNATLNKELHQYITVNAFCFIGKTIIYKDNVHRLQTKFEDERKLFERRYSFCSLCYMLCIVCTIRNLK